MTIDFSTYTTKDLLKAYPATVADCQAQTAQFYSRLDPQMPGAPACLSVMDSLRKLEAVELPAALATNYDQAISAAWTSRRQRIDLLRENWRWWA